MASVAPHPGQARCPGVIGPSVTIGPCSRSSFIYGLPPSGFSPKKIGARSVFSERSLPKGIGDDVDRDIPAPEPPDKARDAG